VSTSTEFSAAERGGSQPCPLRYPPECTTVTLEFTAWARRDAGVGAFAAGRRTGTSMQLTGRIFHALALCLAAEQCVQLQRTRQVRSDATRL
jgi:hypothetical protein